MLSDTPGSSENNITPENLKDQMAKYKGATVTIYTAGGGESGSGFTGVLSMVTPRFVRLITCVGPVPCCPLGGLYLYGGERSRYTPSLNNIGSAADIPIDKIAMFVHKM